MSWQSSIERSQRNKKQHGNRPCKSQLSVLQNFRVILQIQCLPKNRKKRLNLRVLSKLMLKRQKDQLIKGRPRKKLRRRHALSRCSLDCNSSGQKSDTESNKGLKKKLKRSNNCQNRSSTRLSKTKLRQLRLAKEDSKMLLKSNFSFQTIKKPTVV